MKKVVSVLLVVAMLAAMCLFTACENAKKTENDKYVIGIVQQQPHVALDSASNGFMDSVKAELGEENVEFLLQHAQGDSNTCTTIVTDFVTKNVDLILGNATTALQSAANATDTIPVLGTSVTEYGVALGIDNFNGLVGGNVSGTSDLAPLDEQAAMLLELFPDTKTVGMLYCSAEPNSEYQVKKVREYLEAKNVVCSDFPFADSNDIAAVAAAAAAASDVLYIPTDNTAADCKEAINNAVLPTKTPIVGGDEGICSGCGVATLCIDYYDLGVTTGKMAAKILKGEADISQMEIAYAEEYLKVYNKTICDELAIDTAKLEQAGYKAIEQ